MQGQLKKLVTGLGAVFLVTVVGESSFAAKEAISDKEMDLVTAAGQPTVLQAIGRTSAVVTVSGQTLTATTSAGGGTAIAMSIDNTSQGSLRALTLNNVVGENQVATGLNINTAAIVREGQSNTITQSWGAVTQGFVRTRFIPIPGPPHCPVGALICKLKDGDASHGLHFVDVPITIAADKIVFAVAQSGTAAIVYNPSTLIALDLANASQSSLAALTVNNVAGLNQAATGTNIRSGAIAIPGTTGLTFASAGGGTTAGDQANYTTQYRGAPVGYTSRDNEIVMGVLRP